MWMPGDRRKTNVQTSLLGPLHHYFADEPLHAVHDDADFGVVVNSYDAPDHYSVDCYDDDYHYYYFVVVVADDYMLRYLSVARGSSQPCYAIASWPCSDHDHSSFAAVYRFPVASSRLRLACLQKILCLSSLPLAPPTHASVVAVAVVTCSTRLFLRCHFGRTFVTAAATNVFSLLFVSVMEVAVAVASSKRQLRE